MCVFQRRPGCSSFVFEDHRMNQSPIAFQIDEPLVEIVIRDHWDEFMQRKFVSLAKTLGIDLKTLEGIVEIIKHLDPKPGRKYSNERAIYVEPDVYVHKVGDEYVIVLNEDGMPKLRVSPTYRGVLGEGVDLHLECRYVVHHDLAWNPSTLEQRTGRVDRIGAKAERARRPIHVYLPFVTATQDEKMFRVVRDRERWFSVVMGEKYELDEASTERLTERVSFPEEAARTLAFDLSVPA